MKLGFVSAILPDQSLEQVLDFAAQEMGQGIDDEQIGAGLGAELFHVPEQAEPFIEGRDMVERLRQEAEIAAEVVAADGLQLRRHLRRQTHLDEGEGAPAGVAR